MIESLNNSKVKYAVKLKQKKYRTLNQEFLVEGLHLIEEAIKTASAITIFTTENTAFENVETIVVSDDVMLKLSSLNEAKGYVAICTRKANKNLSDKILLLDQVQDPGNMGTLIRTAAAFGFNTVISDNSVDYYNDKVIRSSQGAIFYLDLLEGDISKFIKANPDYSYYSTDVKTGTDIRNIKISVSKIGLILGNEGSGVRPEIKQLSDFNLKIPMESTESLNVGIAGGILMYELFRRK